MTSRKICRQIDKLSYTGTRDDHPKIFLKADGCVTGKRKGGQGRRRQEGKNDRSHKRRKEEKEKGKFNLPGDLIGPSSADLDLRKAATLES